MKHMQMVEAKQAHVEKRYDPKESVKRGGGYPVTSAGEIGWRCKQIDGHSAEIAKRRKSHKKTHNWPRAPK